MKKIILKLVTIATSLSLVMTFMLFNVSATQTEIPSKPVENANLISGEPIIDSGEEAIYSYADGKLSTVVGGGQQYFVNYPLGNANKDDTFVIQTDVTIKSTYDSYSGPIVIFRSSGEAYYGLAFQTGQVYLAKITLNGSAYSLDIKGAQAVTWTSGDTSLGTLKILSSPDSVTATLTQGGNEVTLFDNVALDDFADSDLEFGIISVRSVLIIDNCEVYNTVDSSSSDTSTDTTGDVSTDTTGDASTDTTGDDSSDTVIVDVGPQTVPSAPSGGTNLISNSTKLLTGSDLWTFSGGIVKALTYNVREFATLDTSKSGLTANDNFMLSCNLKVTSHVNVWSGAAIAFRGSDGGNFYCITAQENAIYLMKYSSTEYADGSSFEVIAQVDHDYADNDVMKFVIYSTPEKVSVFLDGNLIFDYVTLENEKPMVGVLSSLANFEISNISLYKMDSIENGDYVSAPGTGEASTLKVVILLGVVIAAGSILLLTSRKKCML